MTDADLFGYVPYEPPKECKTCTTLVTQYVAGSGVVSVNPVCGKFDPEPFLMYCFQCGHDEVCHG